jgi:hypothetical protein
MSLHSHALYVFTQLGYFLIDTANIYSSFTISNIWCENSVFNFAGFVWNKMRLGDTNFYAHVVYSKFYNKITYKNWETSRDFRHKLYCYIVLLNCIVKSELFVITRPSNLWSDIERNTEIFFFSDKCY